jgi:hypothetical protein
MKPRDVRECVEIVAKHPAIGPRYGNRIGDLSKVWLRLLTCEAQTASVFQEDDDPRAPICFVGFPMFVTDDFVREMKAPPLRWIGPELMERILGGNSPVLSNRQFREANSRDGLNLLVWEGCMRPEFETNIEVTRLVLSGFIEVHSGFLLKEVVNAQVESAERLRWTLQAGGLLWNPASRRYQKSLNNKDPEEIVKNPNITGTTREVELGRRESWNASWLGALFDYHPPRFGFRPSEQRMLLMALEAGTDRELARELGVSVPTVKKMWLSIYRRVEGNLPEVNSNHPQPDPEIPRRGKEKRRHLLAYLRKHPEELRPVSRKLLSKPTRGPSRKYRSPRNAWLIDSKS